MNTRTLIALLAALAVTGCGGGSGTSGTPSPNPTSSPSGGSSAQEVAVGAANSLGTSVKDIQSDVDATSPITASSAALRAGAARRMVSSANGACTNGVEFFAPDKNGDANSTETLFFYDAACTEVARDAVRLYTISGTSETVNRTVNLYSLGSATPIAVRTDAVAIAGAQYDQYGFPVASYGFSRTEVDQLQLANVKTIVSDHEAVLEPAAAGVSAYCSDSAGYDATGLALLGETFGWAGGTSGGSRTLNGDGSVTWAGTHAGSSSKGPIGSLAIAIGSTPNTACPIATPYYTLTGGSVYGSYNIPVSATYADGMLTNLTISNATLSNGNTLTVTTNTSVSPTNSQFITGTIASATATIAVFNVDAFGDGTLTIQSTGRQYVITDWHVIK